MPKGVVLNSNNSGTSLDNVVVAACEALGGTLVARFKGSADVEFKLRMPRDDFEDAMYEKGFNAQLELFSRGGENKLMWQFMPRPGFDFGK